MIAANETTDARVRLVPGAAVSFKAEGTITQPRTGEPMEIGPMQLVDTDVLADAHPLLGPAIDETPEWLLHDFGWQPRDVAEVWAAKHGLRIVE